MHDPLIWYEGSAISNATRRYVRADPRGSIVAVTDYQGTSIATNSYDEYGIPDTATGNDISTKGRFRYTGQAWIPELGMYYYKARIYSPTLGRFLQTDPIGYEDQFNLYAYVANDPVNGIDPAGTDTLKTTGGVGIGGSEFSLSLDIDFENGEITGEVNLRIGAGPESTGGVSFEVTESGPAQGNRVETSYEGTARANAGVQIGRIEASTGLEKSYGGKRWSSDRGVEEIAAGETEFESPDASIVPGIGFEADLGGSVGVDLKASGTISIPKTIKKVKDAIKAKLSF